MMHGIIPHKLFFAKIGGTYGMSFREINRLVWLTIKGRKRVSILLLVILVLLSMFVSATMIAFGTIEATEAEKRAEQYGRWQTMLYAVKQDELERLPGVGNCFASAEFVSDESDIGVVAAAEDDWLNYASVELAEGRFAEDAGEIALVRSQTAAGYEIGDTIAVKHTFYHVRNTIVADGTAENTSIESIYSQYLPYITFPDDLSKYEVWWNKNRANYAMWGEKYDHDFAELDSDTQRIVTIHAYFNDMDQYKPGGTPVFNPSMTYSKNLLAYNGKNITINYVTSQTTLNGEWFRENRGTIRKGEPSCKNIEVYVSYKICGFVEPYSEAWDSDMFDMPSAFVSASEAQDMRAAIELASREDPKIPERERQFIALGYSPDMSVSELYDRVNEVYSAERGDTYGLQLDGADGFVSGYIYGTDELSGETEYLSLAGMGTYTNVVLTSEQLVKQFSIDSLRNGSAQIDGLLPISQSMTAEDAYINQAGRDIRLNTYTYPSGGGSYASLQGFLIASIFVIAFCTLMIAFMTQMKYRMHRENILFALGTNQGDIVKLNAVEGIYYTLISLPIGIGLGFVAALTIISLNVGEKAVFAVRTLPLILALAGCAAVVYLSMIFMSVVGRRMERRRTKIRAHGEHAAGKLGLHAAISRLTGRQLMIGVTAVLAVVACAVFALLLLICGARMEYLEETEFVSKPDYALSSPFGMTEPFADEVAKRLSEVEGVAEVSEFIVGEDIYMACGDAIKGPIFSDRYEKLGDSSEFREFGDDIAHRTDIYSFVYGMPDEMRTRLESAAEVPIDWDAVEGGRACVMIVPRYMERGGKLALSTRARDAYFGDVDGSFVVGGTLKLYADNVSSGRDGAMTKSVTATELEIAAVVSSFDEDSVYPFSTTEDILLISGNSAIKQLYTSIGVRVKSAPEASSMVTRAKTYFGTALGTTNFYCRVSDSATIETERTINVIARDIGATLLSYRSQNIALRSRTEMSVLMFAMLAAAIMLMMLIIYRYVVGSMIESRHREVGILQALGASGGGVVSGYLAVAAKVHLLALVFANAVFFAAVLLAEYIGFGGGSRFFEYLPRFVFGQYPWAAHIAACVSVFVLGTLFYAISACGVCQQSISESIRVKE